MKRIGVFCDVSNLYYCVLRKFGDTRRLDYIKYLAYCKDLGDVAMATTYGVKASVEAHNFIHYLHTNGYATRFKQPRVFKTANGIVHKADCDVDIAVDVVSNLADLDLVVLGSADGDFESLVKYCEEHDTPVVVLGCKISKPLRNIAHMCVEIPKSMLMEEK